MCATDPGRAVDGLQQRRSSPNRLGTRQRKSRDRDMRLMHMCVVIDKHVKAKV